MTTKYEKSERKRLLLIRDINFYDSGDIDKACRELDFNGEPQNKEESGDETYLNPKVEEIRRLFAQSEDFDFLDKLKNILDKIYVDGFEDGADDMRTNKVSDNEVLNQIHDLILDGEVVFAQTNNNGTDIINIDYDGKAYEITFQELDEESIELDEDLDELVQCPKCLTKDKLCCFTSRSAGMNGIQEGDEDDDGKLECHVCGHVFEHEF